MKLPKFVREGMREAADDVLPNVIARVVGRVLARAGVMSVTLHWFPPGADPDIRMTVDTFEGWLEPRVRQYAQEVRNGESGR